MRWGWAQRNEVRLVKRRNFSFPILILCFSRSKFDLPRAGFQKQAMRSRPFWRVYVCTVLYGVQYNTCRCMYVCTWLHTMYIYSSGERINLPPSWNFFFLLFSGVYVYHRFLLILVQTKKEKMQPYSLLPLNLLLLLSLVTAAPAPSPDPAPDITYNPTKEASCLVKWEIQSNSNTIERYEVAGQCMFLGSVDKLCSGGYRAPGFCPGGMYIYTLIPFSPPFFSSSFLICSY